MDNDQLFNHHRVYFDDGDRQNASLYLCVSSSEAGAGVVESIVTLMRNQGLWSATGMAEVREDQRQAYIEQLQLLDHREYATPWGSLVVARCEHPKYPSSADRWQDWLDCLDRNRDSVIRGETPD